MTLREQFEEWCKEERNHTDVSRVKKYPSAPGSVADEYMNPVVELAWKAFQAGYEASRSKEMRSAIEDALKIADLWLPTGDVAEEHVEEARALQLMHDQFQRVVSQFNNRDDELNGDDKTQN